MNGENPLYGRKWSISIATNPDGTAPVSLFGNYTARICACYEPHAIPGSQKILFVAGAHHADVGGTLVVLDPSRVGLDAAKGGDRVDAVEGDGEVAEYVGGYSDYLRQRPAKDTNAAPKPAPKPQAQPKPQSPRTRLSFNETRELDQRPGRIDALAAEIAKLEAELADPGLYARDAARFRAGADRADSARTELEAAEERWLELETKREEAGGKP